MAIGFSDTVAKFARDAEQAETDVLHHALRGLDQAIVDKTPVVTGNLRNSRTVSTLGPPAIDWKVKKFRDPDDAINNAVAGVELGQTTWLGFRAPYAHKIEPERGMLRLAAQRWRQIVADAVRAVRGGR